MRRWNAGSAMRLFLWREYSFLWLGVVSSLVVAGLSCVLLLCLFGLHDGEKDGSEADAASVLLKLCRIADQVVKHPVVAGQSRADEMGDAVLPQLNGDEHRLPQHPLVGLALGDLDGEALVDRHQSSAVLDDRLLAGEGSRRKVGEAVGVYLGDVAEVLGKDGANDRRVSLRNKSLAVVLLSLAVVVLPLLALVD